MKPITREEQYLNRLTGEEGIIPDKPVTREEQYFARLCGENNVIPDKPVTRREQYLATLCGEDVITPTKPVTRIEQYMAFASGESESKPAKPITREEMYWDKYQGGDVPEEKTIAFTDIITVTDALARAAVDLQSEITATQNLNGYEYPWVGGAGKNLCPPDIEQGAFNENGLNTPPSSITYPTRVRTQGYIPINSGTTITVSATGNAAYFTVSGYTVNDYTTPRIQSTSWIALGGSFTINEDVKYIRIAFRKADTSANITPSEISDVMCEYGTTATAYAPYENICPITGRNTATVYHGATEQTAVAITTELGRTVYGGTLDLTTGELKITHAYADLGDLTWALLSANLFRTTLYSKKDGTTNFTTTCYRTVNKTFTELQNGETQSITLSEHGHPLRLIHVKDERATTAEEFTTLVTGQKMVYELATPQTISLTPTEVQMLENNNTIWADSGRVQLTYLSKAAQRVQTMNASLKANTLKLTKGAIK